jgi:enterobactin synthetase component D
VAIALRLELPHGRCVGVTIPVETETSLHPDERVFAQALGEARRPSWIAGRLALRAALAEVGIDAPAILATDRGGPLVPAGAVGSISHKRTLAVGLAAARAGAELGVDLELVAPLRVDIARRVLTPDEQAALATLSPEARHREILLRLSCKEAIYKALDPFVRRHVGFQEVSVVPQPDGSTTTTMSLARGEGPFSTDVRWRTIEVAGNAYFLTTARIAAL